tara:strand:+ start:225 stop:599 length:375 start_codon:yes stop_codon:yes gene_type:complete
MKSPKHPQSVTLLKYAEKKVKKVKNTISIKLPHTIFLTCIPSIRQMPKNISNRITKMDINKLKGIRKSNPKTSKYSCSLYENPKGSINLTNPEKSKNDAYEKRTTLIMNLCEINFIRLSNIDNT